MIFFTKVTLIQSRYDSYKNVQTVKKGVDGKECKYIYQHVHRQHNTDAVSASCKTTLLSFFMVSLLLQMM